GRCLGNGRRRGGPARRFLFVPARAEAPGELDEDAAQRDRAPAKPDDQVIEAAAPLADDPVVGLAVDGLREFACLFPDLRADLRRARVVQALRVARLAGRGLAGLEQRFELREERLRRLGRGGERLPRLALEHLKKAAGGA